MISRKHFVFVAFLTLFGCQAGDLRFKIRFNEIMGLKSGDRLFFEGNSIGKVDNHSNPAVAGLLCYAQTPLFQSGSPVSRIGDLDPTQLVPSKPSEVGLVPPFYPAIAYSDGGSRRRRWKIGPERRFLNSLYSFFMSLPSQYLKSHKIVAFKSSFVLFDNKPNGCI